MMFKTLYDEQEKSYRQLKIFNFFLSFIRSTKAPAGQKESLTPTSLTSRRTCVRTTSLSSTSGRDFKKLSNKNIIEKFLPKQYVELNKEFIKN